MPTKQKKKSKAATPALSVVLSTFDREHGRPSYRQIRRADIRDFAEVHRGEYRPSGLTPLLDATASFITDLYAAREKGAVTIGLLLDESGSMAGNRDAVIAGINDFVEGMREAPRDPEAAGKVLAVISTDGGENASRETSREAVQAMVANAEEDGFTFIFIGASMDAWGEARGLGLSGTASGQSISSVNTPAGTAATYGELRNRGVGYIGDNAAFASTYSALANTSLSEDGEVTVASTGSQPAAGVRAYGDVESALERAAESTRSRGAS